MFPSKSISALFFLLLVTFSSCQDGNPFFRQTLTDPPASYPYLASQEILSFFRPFPTILQVSTEQSITNDLTASSDWTNPKGQTRATLRDLLWQGVRSFQFDIHYIQELVATGLVSNAGFRVCKSVTDEVSVRPLCDGDRNTELGISLDNATCRDEGVFPEYGIHAGCPPDSPFLGDVLNAFDQWVAQGNPAFVTLRFKDFTTSGFVPEWAESAVQDQLNTLIQDTLGRSLFVPEEGVDYSDVANWPSLKEVVNSGKRLMIFSNSTLSPYVFDDALLDEEDFVGVLRREDRKAPISLRQTEPFFGYTLDVAQRIVIQGVTVTESGTPLLPNDVPPILSSFRTPSILRLSFDHLDELVWGFDEDVAFDSDLECVISDPARGYRWYQSDCDQNYRVACAVDNSAPFTFGEVRGNDYGSRNGNDFCEFPFLHSAPTSPQQQEMFMQQAMASGISEPIYLNIRFTTNQQECDCDSGCWNVPESGISGVPLSSFCVVPQIEIIIPVDTEPIVDDDDDDLTAGEIAAIVILSVFVVLLLLLLLLFFMFRKGGSNEVTGRVGVVDEDDEDDERYKQGRGALTTADTKAATNIEYPETGVDLDAQVDLGQEEEATGPANKRKIGALEVSSQSMRDYRNEVGKD